MRNPYWQLSVNHPISEVFSANFCSRLSFLRRNARTLRVFKCLISDRRDPPDVYLPPDCLLCCRARRSSTLRQRSTFKRCGSNQICGAPNSKRRARTYIVLLHRGRCPCGHRLDICRSQRKNAPARLGVSNADFSQKVRIQRVYLV